jgi:hypothetical protein
MKNIDIFGKRQKDKINKLNDPNMIALRDCMKNISSDFFNYDIQKTLIHKLYLEEKNIEYSSELLREIEKKIYSYKTQDINKNKYAGNNITREEIIEKLVACKLKCFYCKKNVLLFYNKVRDMEQWTLDRIDNSINHSCDNVIIACLHCNLQRRCQNKDKFLFTKQLKIIKQY